MYSRRSFLKQSSLLSLTALGLPSLALSYQDQIDPDIVIQDVKAMTFREGYDKGIYVRIETNDGTVGWGECSHNGMEVISTLVNSILAPQVIGKSPFDTEQHWEQMFWVNHDMGAGGALTYAIAGVDCAMWDLKGKILGVPVYQMIGGKMRDRVTAYGGFGIQGGELPIKEAVAKSVKLAEKGFKLIKIRSQIREYNLNPTDDPSIPYYQAIRKALPDQVELFLDPNEGYTGYRAIQVGKMLEDMGMKYYESPCPNEDLADIARVVDAMEIPVMAGEKCYNRWMFRDLITQGNPDIINPDFIKSGGITEGIKICHLAQVYHKEVVPHNAKPMLGSAATMQILATIPNCGPMVEYIEADRYPQICGIFDKGIKFEEGDMLLPEQNGLGLVINEQRARNLFGY